MAFDVPFFLQTNLYRVGSRVAVCVSLCLHIPIIRPWGARVNHMVNIEFAYCEILLRILIYPLLPVGAPVVCVLRDIFFHAEMYTPSI